MREKAPQLWNHSTNSRFERSSECFQAFQTFWCTFGSPPLKIQFCFHDHFGFVWVMKNLFFSDGSQSLLGAKTTESELLCRRPGLYSLFCGSCGVGREITRISHLDEKVESCPHFESDDNNSACHKRFTARRIYGLIFSFCRSKFTDPIFHPWAI